MSVCFSKVKIGLIKSSILKSDSSYLHKFAKICIGVVLNFSSHIKHYLVFVEQGCYLRLHSYQFYMSPEGYAYLKQRFNFC